MAKREDVGGSVGILPAGKTFPRVRPRPRGVPGGWAPSGDQAVSMAGSWVAERGRESEVPRVCPG